MKRLIIILGLILAINIGYSQVSNVPEFRIANATTAFGKNLPLGTKVYNVATGEYWVATAGVLSTATLTTASGSFTQLNGGAADQDLSYDSANHEVDITGGTSATIPLAVDDGATEGLASFTAADFDVTAGNVAIDYTNAQKATNAQPGFATAAHITAIEANTAKVGLTDSDYGDITVGSSGTTMTIDADAVTYSKIQNVVGNNVLLGNNAGAGSVVAELSASDVRTILNVADGAEANLTSSTESFEEDDGTPTAHSLGQTAVTAQGCRVSLNGATLDPDDYTLTTSTITLDGPVYQYDKVIITYFY